MKSIQLKILLSFLLLASHKANSMSREELSPGTGANRDEVIAAQNAQQDQATEPQAAASSTSVANPETSELSAWGWEPASTDKAPENGDVDGAPLSTDHSHDVCASTHDADTHADTQGPFPSHPAPTDDDDISDIVSIHSDDDDSESAAAATSSAVPQAPAAASTLPTEYAFITAGDSSQRAEEELLAYAQNVFNGVRTCIAALNDPCLNNNELKQDALDAQSLVNWATALHKQSKDNRSFILVPKSTLDTCLARLKKLSEKIFKNQPTLKVEINYTNPNGMGDIDTFDIPLNLMPEQTTQAAASSASAHPLTDDNNDDDWTTDEEEAGQSFDSQSAPQAETYRIEYSIIEDENGLLSYAQRIKAGIEAKMQEMTPDEKLLWQETIACDSSDTAEIISWVTALVNSKAGAVPTGTINKITKRLHQLALVYSKKDHTILRLHLAPDINYADECLFNREINIYSSDEDASSNDDESSSEFSSSSGDDSNTNTQPKKTDSKSQSDGSTSDDEDDTSSVLSEDDSTEEKPLKNQKTPPVITSSFTGNILKLVKNKLVLAGGAVAAAIWYWQYYYAPDEDGADQPA